MTDYNFFGYLARMKLIKRWSLMRNIQSENIAEHSLQVAQIAHALALISKQEFGVDIDERDVVILALYHDVGEVIIGDLPTPVKYFNPQIKEAYGQIEEVAKNKLLGMLPPQMAAEYRQLFSPPAEQQLEQRLIKAADKIAAYVKCLEESMAGNGEFVRAEESIRKEIAKYTDLPAVAHFMEFYVQSFSKTLDELD